MLTILLPLLVGTADAQTLPKDTPVPNAVYVDVNEAALGRFDDIIASFIPPLVDLDEQLDGVADFDGDIFDIGVLGASYDFGVENVVVVPELDFVTILPRDPPVCREGGPGAQDRFDNGYLDADVQVKLSLSPPPNPPAHAFLDVSVSLLGIIEFDIANFDCDIRMIEEPAVASIDIYAGTITDPRTSCPYPGKVGDPGFPFPCQPMDLRIDQFSWRFGENNGTGDVITTNIDDIDLDCGGLINFIIDVAGAFGLDPIDLLIDTALPDIEGEIDTILADVQNEARTALNDFFPAEDGYAFVETFDLLGNDLTVEVCPTGFGIDDRGLRFEAEMNLDIPDLPAPCISPYDPGGSKRTVPPLPPRYTSIGDYHVDAFGPNNPPQFAAGLDDDFGNKALYALWYSGLLCFQLDTGSNDLGIDLPIPLDSSLIGLLSAGAFDDLFPEPQPLLIATRPEAPPLVETDDGVNQAYVRIDDLGIDFYADVDSRKVRMFALNMKADVGIDVDFDGSVGVLGAAIDVDPAAIEGTVVFNEMRPEASTTIEDGFGGLLETVAEPLIASLLEDFTFDIPAFAGIGLETAFLTPAGPGGDFLGVFGSVGLVDYGDDTIEGCDIAGGDCAAGCTSVTVPSRIPMVLIPLLVALFRRRRQDDPQA